MLVQQNRFLEITTPFGKDAVAIIKMVANEELGRLSTYELDLVSDRFDLDFKQIIGEGVTIQLETLDASPRYFNGVVSHFVQVEPENSRARYKATVVPWLWFLTQTSNCRIFQDKTVRDIIEQVFKGHGFKDYELRLTGNYPQLNYCVQYCETDFDFISRLMELEGMYYFFTHTDGKHTLILADTPNVHDPCPNYEVINYRPTKNPKIREESLLGWTIDKKFLTTNFVHKGYDFKNPTNPLVSMSEVPREHPRAGFEFFDYPGESITNRDGERYVKTRIEGIQVDHEFYRGFSNARGILVGHTFKLDQFYRDDENREYLVTGMKQTIISNAFASKARMNNNPIYECTFSAINKGIPFRSARITPRPTIPGPQTAVIVGPEGQEIHTDEFGRVKVQFRWDRDGQYDENSSCWIRTAQNWGGNKWGTFFLPRIGQEVIVEFLNGDPDLPIITGCVYNGDNKPPYKLPKDKTISTIKSYSTKGGSGFNEIRFQDKKGEEEIYVHAQKDTNTAVENDQFEKVGNNQHILVKADSYEHIENNRHITVDNDHIEEIGKDRHVTIKGKEAIEINDSQSIKVSGDVIHVYKGSHSEKTSGSVCIKGGSVVIDAGCVSLVCGGNHVTVGSGGVTIKGSVVTIDGGVTNINCGPGPGPGGGAALSPVPPLSPTLPEPDPYSPTPKPPSPGPKPTKPGPKPGNSKPTNPHRPHPEKTSWIEIDLVDQDGQPVPGEYYRIELPDGSTADGALDQDGFARVDGIDPGTCKISFPRLDKDAWGPV